MILDPLYGFVFFGLFSPGPNVVLLTASGARFGLRRTLPHLFGVVLGVGVTAGLTGLGIAALLREAPALELILKIAASGWMMWMAWGLWTADRRRGKADRDRPMTLIEGALFQWVNPKAWSMALSAITLYAPGRGVASVLWVAGIYVACSLVSTSGWTVLGTAIGRLLGAPRRLRIFNIVMAILLVATLVPVFFAGASA